MVLIAENEYQVEIVDNDVDNISADHHWKMCEKTSKN